MNATPSAMKRKLPEVRVACFCDQVIQGTDNALSVIRIIDRVTVELVRPLSPTNGPTDRIPYHVTLFAILDGVRAWRGNPIEIWARTPRKPFERKAEIQLELDDPASDTANFIIPTAIDLRRPGLFEVELRLDGKRLARRQLELVVGVPVEPSLATDRAE